MGGHREIFNYFQKYRVNNGIRFERHVGRAHISEWDIYL